MSLGRRGAAWVAVLGTAGGVVAAALLGSRYVDDAAVLVEFGAGVAVVGAVLSVGLLGIAYAVDVDGDPPSTYVYPATAGSASVLLLVAADAHADGPPFVPVALLGAAVLLVVGSALVFAAELRR